MNILIIRPANGKDKITFANGETFEGNYVNGQPIGLGRWTFKNGVDLETDYRTGNRA